jgi:hypothetical protein
MINILRFFSSFPKNISKQDKQSVLSGAFGSAARLSSQPVQLFFQRRHLQILFKQSPAKASAGSASKEYSVQYPDLFCNL